MESDIKYARGCAIKGVMHSWKDMALGGLIVVMLVLAYHSFNQQNAASRGALQAAAALAANSAQQNAGPTGISQTNDQSSQSGTTCSQSEQPIAPVYYEYRLAFDVDPCTFNTLGKGGWEPIEYGHNPDTSYQIQGEEIHLAPGKDTSCTRPGYYNAFIWILFKRSTTTPAY